MPVEFHTTIPFLACADVEAALEFYVEKLGFEKDWTRGEPPTDGGVRRGHICLYFMQNAELAARVRGSEVMLQVSPLADVYKEHLARQAPISAGITEEPWGVREYSVTDPHGYRLRFYEPLRAEL
jgi:catechol 2,3-dioxygenase-like lactoylglutathione lyase family enzyme